MVNPQYVDFVGTITDPPVCDALGNLENTIVVKNLTGEITQPGQSQFHRIRLDPYRSYMIEAIGQIGEDMLGVEEHPNLTLSNPDIPAIWNAKATSKWITYGDRNDGDQPKNVIRRFLDSDYRTYKVEVNSGNRRHWNLPAQGPGQQHLPPGRKRQRPLPMGRRPTGLPRRLRPAGRNGRTSGPADRHRLGQQQHNATRDAPCARRQLGLQPR